MAVSLEYIQADPNGHPDPHGPDGHFVVRSDQRLGVVPPVNQMHAGGRYADLDCADAGTRYVLLWLGFDIAVSVLEAIEKTAPPWGTGLAGIVAGFASVDIPSRVDSGPMAPGWIMQPADGTLVAPAQSGPFVAASNHKRVVVDATPQSTPMTPAEQAAFNQLSATVSTLMGGETATQLRTVEFAYMLCLGRTVEPAAFGNGTINYWRNVMNQSSWESFIEQLAGTAEGQAFARTGIPDIRNHPGAVAVPRPPIPTTSGGTS